ncbi:hypothetical protein ES707_15251 [subsurface metagenome]
MSDKTQDKPEVTPQQAENAIVGLFASVYPSLVQAITQKFGREAYELARNNFIDTMVENAKQAFPGPEKRTLKDFHEWLSANICVGHQYKVDKLTESELQYTFTACPWADYFREVGEPEIGRFFCEVDEPMVKTFNGKVCFERTKTLMDGDAICNHHYAIPEKV